MLQSCLFATLLYSRPHSFGACQIVWRHHIDFNSIFEGRATAQFEQLEAPALPRACDLLRVQGSGRLQYHSPRKSSHTFKCTLAVDYQAMCWLIQ